METRTRIPLTKLHTELNNGFTMSVVFGFGTYSNFGYNYEVAFWKTGGSGELVRAPGFAEHYWADGIYAHVPREEVVAYAEANGLPGFGLRAKLHRLLKAS